MDKDRSANANHTAKPRATISDKTLRPFFFGIVGWFVLHTLFWGAIELIAKQMGPSGILLVPVVFVPAPANIITLVLLLTRPAGRSKALGVLSAFVINSLGILFVTPDESPLLRIFVMRPFFLH
jgi:hypothetical protein